MQSESQASAAFEGPTLRAGPDATQPPLLLDGDDGNQYHIFCADGRIFSIWLLRAGSMAWQWAWVYDAGKTRQFYRSAIATEQVDGSDLLDTRGPGFQISTNPDGSGTISVSDGASNALEAEFGEPVAYVTQDIIAENLGGQERCIEYPEMPFTTVSFGGKKTRGSGYMKRWIWPNPTEALTWRFFEGRTSDDRRSIWAPDAMFGFKHYTGFRVVTDGHDLYDAEPETSYHGYDCVHSVDSDGKATTVTVSPLAEPVQCRVTTPTEQSSVQQTPVAFTYKQDGNEIHGTGIYEMGYIAMISGSADPQ